MQVDYTHKKQTTATIAKSLRNGSCHLQNQNTP